MKRKTEVAVERHCQEGPESLEHQGTVSARPATQHREMAAKGEKSTHELAA